MRRASILATTAVLAAAAVAPAATAAATTGGQPPVGVALAATRAKTLSAEQQRAPQAAHALGLDDREGLRVRDVVEDADGSTHVRYDRTFAGLRVVGGDLVAHLTPSGAVRRADRAGSGAVDVDSTEATVSQEAATATAVTATARSRAGYTPDRQEAELVVYARGSRPVLAYEVVTEGIRPDQTPSRLHTVVDARTGRRLAQWDDVKNGTGSSVYSGTVTIGTTRGTSGYSLTDGTRGGTWTTDLGGATSGSGTTFMDADDVWGSGTTTDRASAAVDAHYGAQLTWDYFKTTHGRSGIFNDGRGVRSRVHYGNGYVNAFWDGIQMTYGDGAANTHPLTSIDVAGHEMSHGVTEATANLDYSGDAGGLNEATSDIFGTAVEFAAGNPADPGDYLIGEKIDINGNGTPLRYLDRPSRDGSSPDCWSTGTAALDPHQSSGVGNHFFYLAGEGSGAKTVNGVAYNSPTCNGSTVAGIGRAAVERIWYRALTTYMTSTTTYSQARDATMRAATDLYGPGSTQCAGVEKAWAAVSVPAGSATCSGGATPPSGSGNLVANAGFESGATAWSSTAGSITSSASRPAHSGSWKAWLGGNGTSASENVAQSVTIPSTASSATLSFWLRTDTAESGSTAYDTLKVQVVSAGTVTTLATYSNVGANATWAQKQLSLAAYKGKTVTVRLVATEDVSLQTSFVVDDTAVTTS
ncbi:MAG TPA: M4 family metallopeptidase [Actinomycetales bacterium]|nr:M4 family metallopeptidase [Actinomycetales bacterium]